MSQVQVSDAGAVHPPAKPVKPGDHVYLIDGSGYIFRAYHALPPLTRPSDGLPVGAVHGFCQMLWKLLCETRGEEKPTHIAVIFDHSRETFRNTISPSYKANRPPAPDDLIPQFALIRAAVRAFNVACIEQAGFEADDLIATYARLTLEAGGRATIVSSDKDMMQLIRPGIVMLDTMKNKRIGAAEVIEKFGVEPGKVIDVQALIGDPVDNVPGVPGIGVKTAAQLIAEFGDLDTLLSRAGEIKQTMRRERLIEFAAQARLSRELVKLDENVRVEEPLDALADRQPQPELLLTFLREMEFNVLTRRVAAALAADAGGAQAPPLPPEPRPVKPPPLKPGVTAAADAGGSSGPAELAVLRAREAANAPVDRSRYETLTRLARLQEWIAEAIDLGAAAFDTETSSLDPMQAELCGVSLALAPGKACYVPLGHGAGDCLDLEGIGATVQIPMGEAIAALKPLLEDESVLKIGQNIKFDYLVMLRHGIRINPIDDTMLLSYVLDANKGGHGMDELPQRHLGHNRITFKEVAGKGKPQVSFNRVAAGKAAEYAAEDADLTLRLWQVLKPRLAAERLTTVYETLERPLIPVLAAMEQAGVKVERNLLARLSGEFTQRLGALEAEIHALAGEKFNVGSTKQLIAILFGKLGLPGATKTSTGAWSTRAGVLEDLVNSEELTEEQKKLPRQLLEWRQLAKLKSTYTDALPNHINPHTGRIHTCYSLAATTTGRLSSTEPNLQNIPVRTLEGRQIRAAFIAGPGNKLISADYSQIELRVLAHIAGIPALKQAFAEGLDIHAMTASEMFGAPIEGMPPEVRRRAKAINFGIIYGISAFGLAAQLGIPRGEAGEYIKRYFERFPGIRAYMETAKQQARDSGYVTTLFGRKIHYALNTASRQFRGNLERAAINAPIQGTAADIIRRAMIRMPAALAKAGLSARMLLQVHDELVFEAPEGEAEATIKTAAQVMERAAEPAVALSVPLKVDARAADNWDAAH